MAYMYWCATAHATGWIGRRKMGHLTETHLPLPNCVLVNAEDLVAALGLRAI